MKKLEVNYSGSGIKFIRIIGVTYLIISIIIFISLTITALSVAERDLSMETLRNGILILLMGVLIFAICTILSTIGEELKMNNELTKELLRDKGLDVYFNDPEMDEQEDADYWECPKCYEVNRPSAYVCRKCGYSTFEPHKNA
jgi:ribosomal protein L40E